MEFMELFQREDERQIILGKLPMRDVVRFHYGCSKECRELTRFCDSRVFEGEPFFLYHSSSDSNPSYYAFSLQRWVRLVPPTGLLLSFQHLRPVSTSGGLVLFSGVPGYCKVLQLRQWWPLVVVNPITRENRLLLLLLEMPSQFPENWCPEYYSGLLMGLKVSADSKTYKVVVHWTNNNVFQIFDSGSHQWSTVLAPIQLEAYSNSSNEVVVCHNYGEHHALGSSVFDIGHGMVVDWRFREDLGAANLNPSGKVTTQVTVESCLYALRYNKFVTTSFWIYKKERSDVDWQLVTQAPWMALFQSCVGYTDARTLTLGVSNIYECGKCLLFAMTFDGTWGGALYDLEKRVWDPHFVVKRDTAWLRNGRGFFFQPQLNGPPC